MIFLRRKITNRCTWLWLFTTGCLLAVMGCASISKQPVLTRFEFKQPHMGTLFTITLYAPDEALARAASDAGFAKIADLERIMTDYDPESELMQLCQQTVGKAVPVSAELFEVVAKAQEVAALSAGAFDITIGPVVRLWRRARRAEALPAPDQLARAREAVGWRKLKLDARAQTITLMAPNMQLDLGGLGKGFAADQALAVIAAQGCPRALVAASGDITVGEAPPGQKGWRVSIGTPTDGPVSVDAQGPTAKTLLLANAAVSTAGDSEQFVEINGVRYSHIVDPRTGVGLTNHLQVSVVARRGIDSDAFDTTVRVMGVEAGLALIEKQRALAAFLLVKKGGVQTPIASRRFRMVQMAE